MKKVITNVFALLLFFALSHTAHAQFSTPAPSPGSKLIQKVGLTEITVEYSRPGVKGRKVFGAGDDALEKFGTNWRTGANAATKITFADDIKVGGKELKAGSYAIFSKLGAEEWTVMFFPYDTPNAGGYGDKEPAASVKAAVVKISRGRFS